MRLLCRAAQQLLRVLSHCHRQVKLVFMPYCEHLIGLPWLHHSFIAATGQLQLCVPAFLPNSSSSRWAWSQHPAPAMTG